jgi:queuine tRNA-ribosyltransferase
VVVFDVGLGAAANALAAIACRKALAARGGAVRPLRLISFENDPSALRFALAHAAKLGYVRGYEPALEALADRGRWAEAPGLIWDLRQGDFSRLIHEESGRADIVFFDPFSPRANPAMWSVATLEGVFRHRRSGGALRLVTYSTAPATQAALLLAGFYVGAGAPAKGGRPTTEACSDFSTLRAPLDPRWLGRWKRERRAPWPPNTPAAAQPEVRTALMEHPQWGYFDARSTPRPAPRRTRDRRASGRPVRRRL